MGFLEISRLVYRRSVFHLVSRTSCARSRTHDVLTIFIPTGASWILWLLTFWCSVHSSEKGFGSRSTQVRAGHTGLMSFLHCLQHQIPLQGRAPVLPFLRASPACCATSQVCSVKCHKSCVSCWFQAFLEADLFCHLVGFMLSQSKVAVLTIALQIISINVGKWKQKASMFPVINNMHDCLARSPELEVIHLLLRCWRTFYKGPCLDRALDKPQSKITVYSLVIWWLLCVDSIMNYEYSPCKFGLSIRDSWKAKS